MSLERDVVNCDAVKGHLSIRGGPLFAISKDRSSVIFIFGQKSIEDQEWVLFDSTKIQINHGTTIFPGTTKDAGR